VPENGTVTVVQSDAEHPMQVFMIGKGLGTITDGINLRCMDHMNVLCQLLYLLLSKFGSGCR
jgi:hypothetical protein